MTPNQAHREVYKATKEGRLSRYDTCELCLAKGRMSGHHYNGYDNPLDVWFICYSCNSQLRGYHDGSLTKEQARELIAAKTWAKGWIVAFPSKKATNLWYGKFQGNEAQARKFYRKQFRRMRQPRGMALLNP